MFFDIPSDLINLIVYHRMTLDHLQPSEGYECHYTECSKCRSFYNFDNVISNEDQFTKALANAFQTLQHVSYADAWKRDSYAYETHKHIFIERDGDTINLRR